MQIIDKYVNYPYYVFMKDSTPKQNVELFHLLFLDQLGRKLDKKLYSLKGGCNLRFFLNSIRYSEDIDLDVQIIAKETLQNKINTILTSSTFKQILRTRGIEINTVTKPKQTDTTQRWKLSLNVANSPFPLPTKIEFSRRTFGQDVKFSTVSSNILSQYHLQPIMLNHYPAEKAYEQKLKALIFRSQTQARDIFDLYLLINTGTPPHVVDPQIIAHLEDAKINALSMQFKDFKGQVLAFLPEDYQRRYNDSEVWENIVMSVIQNIENLL